MNSTHYMLLVAAVAIAAPARASDWREVERLRGAGKVAESLDLAEKLRSSGPSTMELDREYALSLNASGRRDESIAVLEKYKALPIDSSSATAINTLGWIYLTRGNYSDAISTLETITNSKSFNFSQNQDLSGKAFNNLGYTLMLVGRTSEAKIAFEKAVSYGNSNASDNLGSITTTSKSEIVNEVSSIDRDSAAKSINEYLDSMDGFSSGGASERKKARESLVRFVGKYGNSDVAVEEIIRRLDKKLGGFKTNQGRINGMTALLDLHQAGSLTRNDLTKVISIGKKLQSYKDKKVTQGDRDPSVVVSTASALAKLSN